MQIAKFTVVGVCLVAFLRITPLREAEACGGCVAPPGTFSAVDSHRMVIKLGAEESILWDQFIYSGAPEEFAWVLPVPSPETVVEIASSAFIDGIDEETSPVVLSPACASDTGGCGGADGFGNFPTLADQVSVHSHALVGPYETVVIGAEDPNAIYAWLGQNGYAFPDSGRPVLDHYTGLGSSFVVLRLRPGVEVSAMEPVRVRFRGYMASFPLKMISLGVVEAVDLSLWVIGDTRFGPANFPSREVNQADLVWDWDTASSNYEDVFLQAVSAEGEAGWVTEYAQVLDESPLAARLQKEAPVDFAMATAATHKPVLTRLRTRLPVEALQEDLFLIPSDDEAMVPRELVAQQSLGDCEAPQASGPLPGSQNNRIQLLFWLLLAGAGLVLRRRGATS